MTRTRDQLRETFTVDLAPPPCGLAAAEAPAGQPWTVSGLAVPYNTPTQRYGTEIVFTRESCRLPADLSTVKLLIQHDDERPVGYATAAEHTDAGLQMSFALPDHPRGADLRAELDAKLRDGLSVGISLDDTVADQLFARLLGADDSAGPVVMAGDLREVSAVSIPQYNLARARTAASASPGHLATFTAPRKDSPPMTTTAPPTTAAPSPTPTVELAERPPVAPADLPTLAELTRAVTDRLGGPAPAHPMAAFGSWTDYADAVWADPRTRFALADQVTADNPGVIAPAWLSEVFGIVDLGAPLTTALAGGPLPPDGMEVNYPYFGGDYTTLVQRQDTEKTPIHSAKVSIARGTAEIETFAGGSDISYQLLRRSSPSYRDAYNRILNLAYAWALDAYYGPAVLAASTSGIDWDPAVGDAAQLSTALFTASTAVRRFTGRPADIFLVSSDVFGRVGGLQTLVNPAYGTQNVPGTASASALRVNVNGLELVEVPALPEATAVVTNSDAVRVYRDGPFPVSAEDVEKLGTNIAVWGMASLVTPAPRGIVTLTAGGGAKTAAKKTAAA